MKKTPKAKKKNRLKKIQKTSGLEKMLPPDYPFGKETQKTSDLKDLKIFIPHGQVSKLLNDGKELQKMSVLERKKKELGPELFSKMYPGGEDDFKTSLDQWAAVTGNASSMDALADKAKDGDKRAFMLLIKFHTFISPTTRLKPDALYIPSLYANKEFYSQDWVQERLRTGFRENPYGSFKKAFWDAVFSWVGVTPANRHAALKRHIIINKERWNQQLTAKSLTFNEIQEDLIKLKVIDGDDYEDIDSFRRFLNKYGVKGKQGRGKNRN